MTPGVLAGHSPLGSSLSGKEDSPEMPGWFHGSDTDSRVHRGQASLHDPQSQLWFPERLPRSQGLGCCLLTNQLLNDLIVFSKYISVMPQECLNFCVNSLVCMFFSFLVGTPIDKAHDLAFPWICPAGHEATTPVGELPVPSVF